ncbi:11919_t:CDS:2, partial [Dentiscutata erythropus]
RIDMSLQLDISSLMSRISFIEDKDTDFNMTLQIAPKNNIHETLTYHQKFADFVYNVGYNYQYGIGVEKNDYKAFIYYKKSAEIGHVDGAFNIG